MTASSLAVWSIRQLRRNPTAKNGLATYSFAFAPCFGAPKPSQGLRSEGLMPSAACAAVSLAVGLVPRPHVNNFGVVLEEDRWQQRLRFLRA